MTLPCSLPEWALDEDMLRRVLILRARRMPLAKLLAECGISENEWNRLRRVAKHSSFAGDRAVATAFLTRFDAIPCPKPSTLVQPRFTDEEGRLLAEDIERWKLPKEGGK